MFWHYFETLELPDLLIAGKPLAAPANFNVHYEVERDRNKLVEVCGTTAVVAETDILCGEEPDLLHLPAGSNIRHLLGQAEKQYVFDRLLDTLYGARKEALAW